MSAFLFARIRKTGDALSERGALAGLPDCPRTDHQADRLHALSRQGLWGILVFLAVSAGALFFRDLTLTAVLPADLLEQLGPRPPVLLINVVLGVSTLSSLVLIFGRLYHCRRPGSTWPHLWFRLSFFGLYFLADALGSHVNMVFISGLAVLALQHYHLSTYTAQVLQRPEGEGEG